MTNDRKNCNNQKKLCEAKQNATSEIVHEEPVKSPMSNQNNQDTIKDIQMEKGPALFEISDSIDNSTVYSSDCDTDKT
eukprot:UN14961